MVYDASSMAACVFCEIAAGRLAASLVLDEPDVVAFLDASPLFQGHVLVVPRAHVVTLGDLNVEQLPVYFAAVQRVAEEFRARPVGVEQVLFEDVDVLSPCALGAVLTPQSIPRLRARVIAGAANNQLAQGEDGRGLPAAGILYAPDYVLNAGGIMSVSREYHGGATEAQVIADIQGIPVRLTEIFERARRENRTTNAVADQMARERLGRHGHQLVA